MKLVPPPFRKFESKLSSTKGNDKQFLNSVREIAEEHLKTLDYIMTRFVEDFGDRIDTETKRNIIYHKFKDEKSRQYADTTRFLRLVEFYETTT